MCCTRVLRLEQDVGQPDILVTLDNAIRLMILKSFLSEQLKIGFHFFITQIARIIKNYQNKKIIF